MTEIDYKICQVIKHCKENFNMDANIGYISKIIFYSKEGTRYHMNKLIKLGIVEKTEDNRYRLLVNNIK